MSLNQPANKEELKEFCLRQLGYPVVQINVDDEQDIILVDRISVVDTPIIHLHHQAHLQHKRENGTFCKSL